MLKEFRDFVFRGNLLDLAVAVVLATAFGAVLAAFTDGILMALIAAIVGEPSFDSVILELGDGQILIGRFLTAVVNFLLIAAALFVILKAAAKATRRTDDQAGDTPSPTDEAVLLAEIRDLLAQRGRDDQ